MALLETQPQRIDEVEEVLLTGVSTARATGLVARKFGIGRRQANEYVRAALQRWRDESTGDARDEKRALIRETLWEILQKAKDRTGVTVDGEGVVHTYDDPDANGAVRALELLCRLDGLLEQPDTSGQPSLTVAEKVYQVYFGTAPPPTVAVPVLPARTIDAPQDDE